MSDVLSQDPAGWFDAGAEGMDKLDLKALTNGRPFCAGVLLLRDGFLLVTLNEDHLPAWLPPGTGWRVGGVGGGQEPGEDIWQCAIREAREELGQDVALVPSPITYVHDIDTDELRVATVDGGVPPFFLQRQRNPDPDKPFRYDLPAGEFTYFALFLAELNDSARKEPFPGDDVAALLWMPLQHWSVLADTPPLSIAIGVGARTIGFQNVSGETRLWLAPSESLTKGAPLLAAYFRQY